MTVRRVCLAPVEIAGYFGALEEGFAQLGVATWRLDLGDHPFGYAASTDSPLARLVRWSQRTAARLPAGSPRVRALGWLESLLRVALLAWAALRCDAFVYGFGSTITWYPERELRLLRRLKRRIVFVFLGSDSRPPYLDTQVMAAATGRTAVDCVRLTAETRRRVALADRHADEIVENPLCGHFHGRPCVSWHALGLPTRVPPVPPVPAASEEGAPPAASRPVRILHCPSHHEFKGTRFVREAIAALQAEGLRIEYVEVSGRPHAEVLAAIDAADLVVDQVFSDTYLAAFATEAAMRGRVPVVAGWGAAELSRFVPEALRPPGVYCEPARLADCIRQLVCDPALRAERARALAEFCRAQRTPRAVAAKLRRLLEGDVPASWRFDPREVRFVGGTGPEPVVRGLLQGVLDVGGPAALGVSDKPALEAALVAFARDGAQEPVAAR